MQISEEEGRLKKDEEETREMWKRKRDTEKQWEDTRENRVSNYLWVYQSIKCNIYALLMPSFMSAVCLCELSGYNRAKILLMFLYTHLYTGTRK
jgi:hypothetical protein